MNKIIKIEINNDLLDKYNKYYFDKYPKRRVKPINNPIPLTLNRFIAMKRMQQNNVKQKYKEFVVWLASYYNIANLNLTKAVISFKFYFPNKRRRDYDNMIMTPKFINDGLVDAGVFIDDSCDVLKFEFEDYCYEKNNPRLIITIKY